MISGDQSEALTPPRILHRKWDIFFSYAREDTRLARALLAALEERGFSVWSGSRLNPGDSLGEIDRALQTSGVAIFLVSSPYLSSKWLRHEVSNAMRTMPAKRLYFIAVDPIEPHSIPEWPAECRWLHLDRRGHVERLVNRIQPSINKLLGQVSVAENNRGTEILGELPTRAPLVGVEGYLRSLLAKKTGITALIGIAGSGKTSLAAEYAYATRDEVDYIAWFSAMTSKKAELNSRLKMLASRVESGKRGLLIVDEWHAIADDSEMALRLVGLANQSRIIITTRDVSSIRTFRGTDCTLVMLEHIPRNEIEDYISFYDPSMKTYSADEIARISDLTQGAPLAVRLMAEVLKRRSLAEVVETYEGNGSSIELVLSAALDQLPSRQRRRLDVLSFSPRLLSMVWGDEDWRVAGDGDLLSYLLDRGIVLRTGSDQLAMPPIVVSFLRSRAPRSALEDAVSYVVERLPDPDGSTSHALLATVAELAEMSRWDFANIDPSDIAELLLWQAGVWRFTIGPERAEEVCKQAIAIIETADNNLLHVRALNLASALAFECGKVEESSRIGQEAAELSIETLGSSHPMSLATLGNLAGMFRSQGNLPAAITILRRVYASMDEDHPEITSVESNLATCLREGGFNEEAHELLNHARMRDIDGQSNLRHRVQIDQNLAALLVDSGRANEALEVLTHTLNVVETILPWDAVEKVEIQTNLAITYGSLGRFDEALSMQVQAVENSEVICGPDHISTVNAVHAYGVLLLKAGRLKDAESVLVEVIKRRMRVLGPDHPETLQAQLVYARTLAGLGHQHRSLDQYRDIATRADSVFGRQHVFSLATREELADLHRMVGESARSIKEYRELLSDLAPMLPSTHPMVMRVQKKASAGKNAPTVTRSRRSLA